MNLIDKNDVLRLVTTKEPQLLDADALYMEIQNIDPVEAIPCGHIRAKAYKASGPERTYLIKLLNDWEKEHGQD